MRRGPRGATCLDAGLHAKIIESIAKGESEMKGTWLGASAAIALILGLAPARANDCTITVGVVMELTGPAGEYGQAGAKSVEMAFRDLNEAGGPHGC